MPKAKSAKYAGVRAALDRYDLFCANQELQQQYTERLSASDRYRFCFLLLLELEGEIGLHRFKRSLETAHKKFTEDKARVDKLLNAQD